MTATPSMSPPRPPQPAPQPDPWTVPQLADQLVAAGLDVRLDEGAQPGDGAYGAQLDFAARASPGPGGQPAAPAIEGLTVLVEIGLIRVAGRDAAQFLQGQLTNDIGLAGTDHAILAGLCNPKGRLIASFSLWRGTTVPDEAGDVFWLACSRDLADVLARRLRMFVLRAKVTVTRHDHDRVALGLIGARAIGAAADALVEHDAPEPRAVVSVPDPGREHTGPAVAGTGTGEATRLPRAIVVATLAELPVLARRATQGGLRWVDSRQWRWLEVQAALPRITAATTERFVPQMVNFERIGGVSFTKGCYPGQEVVARSHYRSKARRRTFLVAGEGELPAPGVDLDPAAGEGEPAGIAVLAARDPAAPSRWALLVEARLESAEAGLAWQGVALAPLGLPYPLVEAPEAGAEPSRG